MARYKSFAGAVDLTPTIFSTVTLSELRSEFAPDSSTDPGADHDTERRSKFAPDNSADRGAEHSAERRPYSVADGRADPRAIASSHATHKAIGHRRSV